MMQPHLITFLSLATLCVCRLSALEVDTDFNGGSIGATKFDPQNNSLHFSSQNPTSDQNPYPAYWYFRIKGLKPNIPLTLQTEALNTQKKTIVAVSEDRGGSWLLREATQKDGALKCIITPSAESLLIASTPPLPSIKLIAELSAISRHRNGVEWITAESTGANTSALPILRVSEGDRVDARRSIVWIQSLPKNCSQNSNWVLLGFTKWLFSADTSAAWLRQNAEVYIHVSETHSPSWLFESVEPESRFRITLNLENETSENQPSSLWISPGLEVTEQMDKAINALMPVKIFTDSRSSHSISPSLKKKITLNIHSWIEDVTPDKAQQVGGLLAAFISKELETSPPP